jgi:transaldolase / glucose-6-phosphate isomerase
MVRAMTDPAETSTELIHVSETLGSAEAAAVTRAAADWTGRDGTTRLWSRDKGLWTGADEDKWLGWLDIVARERRDAASLDALARDAAGCRDVVLIGMGGSSLGPDVIAQSFGRQAARPRFQMIDSTDPDQIASLEASLDLARTLFIVSSKSGTTLEPNILKDYFFARAGAGAGKRFVAVTDPGSAMEREAGERGFAHLFHGDPAIGGRYSVLSKFGLVPAAAMGLDVAALLGSAQRMVDACGAAMPVADNPGIRLGLTLGTLAREFRRDKVTILASKSVASVGSWLEQLLAESTGKQGKGLIPVDGEPVAAPDRYGTDRTFIYVTRAGDDDAAQAAAVAALTQAGHPVIRVALDQVGQLGQLFFVAEIATAVAGAVIGINPFDQPDVEASKVKARALTDAYEKTGKLQSEPAFHAADGISFFADAQNRKALPKDGPLSAILRAHFTRAGAGDYVALLAYIERNAAHAARLDRMRVRLRDRFRCATCVGFGPRFLHSTGQAYKGGPNSGVFLEIHAAPARDLAVPGKKYSFGTVEAAQAQGDFDVLNERHRRALRLYFDDLNSGLDRLEHALAEALAPMKGS